MNTSFLIFVLKMVRVDKRDFILFSAIYTLIVFLLSSFLFLKLSITQDIESLQNASPDLVIQRLEGGKSVNVSELWIEQIEQFDGIESISGRLFSRYYFEPAKKYFTLMSYSLFDQNSNLSINRYLDKIPFRLDDTRGLIVGSGVAKILNKHHYTSNLSFFTPSGKKITLNILNQFNVKSALTTNDVILVPDQYLRQILGIGKGYYTDIAIHLSNQDEKKVLIGKIRNLFADIRILDMKEMHNLTHRFYNQFSGVFLLFLLMPLITFIFLLFSRVYSLKRSTQKQIAILRVMGWPSTLILQWHLLTGLFISLVSYFSGVLFSYGYIYFFNGVGLNKLFLGYGNLPSHYVFTVIPSADILIYIFLFTIPLFLLASLFPAYRLCKKPPHEVLQ